MVGYHGAARLEPRANLMCDVRDAAALFGARDYRYLENPLDRQAEQASLLFEIVGVVDVVVQYRRKKRRPFVSRGEGRLPNRSRQVPIWSASMSKRNCSQGAIGSGDTITRCAA